MEKPDDIKYDFEIKELDDGWEGTYNGGWTMAIYSSEEFKWNYPFVDDGEFTPRPHESEEDQRHSREEFEATKRFKAAIRQYIKDELGYDGEHKWEIQKARFFGYNETTLALIKGPDEQHYLVRSACYPYGKAKRDSAITGIDPQKCGSKPHWNDLLDDIAGEDHNIEQMAAELSALPFIPCETDDPLEEFEAMAEIERFMSRKEIAEKYGLTENATNNTISTEIGDTLIELESIIAAFTNSSRYTGGATREQSRNKTRNLSLYDAFVYTDLNRNQWYVAESEPYESEDTAKTLAPIGKTYLSLDEVKETIETICKDFGIACPKHTSITPYNPRQRSEGQYNHDTTKMRLMQADFGRGVPYDLLLHELAHHINNMFVHDGESESASHGYRFKKIHMHLMHHYAGIDAETLIMHFESIYSGSYSNDSAFELREQDIVGRDFTEHRTLDILPHEQMQEASL